MIIKRLPMDPESVHASSPGDLVEGHRNAGVRAHVRRDHRGVEQRHRRGKAHVYRVPRSASFFFVFMVVLRRFNDVQNVYSLR